MDKTTVAAWGSVLTAEAIVQPSTVTLTDEELEKLERQLKGTLQLIRQLRGCREWKVQWVKG